MNILSFSDNQSGARLYVDPSFPQIESEHPVTHRVIWLDQVGGIAMVVESPYCSPLTDG